MAINSLSASSYGISGLVSGMNTQEMVEKMLSGTKSKIVAQQQKRTQLQYKQELYRNLATQLRTLQTSFFSYSNPTTNLMSTSFFSKMTAATESKYFKANATTSASSGTSNVDYIKQLAKSASLTGKTSVSAELNSKEMQNSDILSALSNYKSNLKGQINFTVDGPDGTSSFSIKVDQLKELAGLSDDAAVAKLNQFLGSDTYVGAGNAGKVKAESVNGKLTFKSTGSSETLMISTSDAAQALFGFSTSSVNGAGSITTQLDTRQFLPSFQVQLDNQEAKTVYFDVDKYLNAGKSNGLIAMEQALQEGFTKAFGDAIKVNSDPSTNKLSFTVKDKSRQFTITGNEKVMDIMGIKSGQSNKMNLSMSLDQVNFDTPLKGDEFKFSINGVGFTFTSDTSLNAMMNAINSSDAGVKMTYNATNDKFKLESTVSGEGSKIEIKQEQGNLMTALFGVQGNTSVAGKSLVPDVAGKSVLKAANTTTLNSTGGSISFDIITRDSDGNAVRRNISLNVPKPEDGKEAYTSKSVLVAAINEALKENTYAQDAGIEFKMDGDDVSIVANKDTMITTSAGAGSVLAELGFTNGQTNGATKNTLLSEMAIGPGFTLNIGSMGSLGQIDMSGATTVEDLITKVNDELQNVGYDARMEWDERESKFRFTGGKAGEEISFGGANADRLFQGKITFEAQDDTTNIQRTEGQNAILSINGNRLERSDNNFTYDGVTFTLTQVFDGRQRESNGYLKLADGNFVDENDGKIYSKDTSGNYVDTGNTVDGTETYMYDERAGQVEVTRDTEQIYEGIVKFVDEYNKIMESLHSLLVEDPEFKDYLPLTDEQKAAMSDREIELWEEKSKTGLLRSDSTLNDIWNDLRTTMYKKPTGSDLAIYNLGITTSASTEYGGQLTIDYSKLREVIASDPEGVKEMFTNSVDGVATALNNAINRAAKISSASPGKLISIAGSTKSDTSSSLYKQMKAIDDNLDTLKNRYDSEYNRYWKQFNKMEQIIQQYNQQSSWLSQQFSS